jgi:hypothetical protein
LNPNDEGITTPSCSTSKNTKNTSLYDFMETNEEMDLSIVKQQINQFLVEKVIEKEHKKPLAWWKMHEV